MATETELKLAASRTVLERLAAATAVRTGRAPQVEREAPLSVGHRSQAEHGYALARPVASHPVKARASGIIATLTAVDAFRTICYACVEHLAANREGALIGEDPEYLHQMRVALRRLRSAFNVFSPLLPEAAVEAPLADAQARVDESRTMIEPAVTS